MKLETKLLLALIFFVLVSGVFGVLYFTKKCPVTPPVTITDTTYVSKPDTIIQVKRTNYIKKKHKISSDSLVLDYTLPFNDYILEERLDENVRFEKMPFMYKLPMTPQDSATLKKIIQVNSDNYMDTPPEFESIKTFYDSLWTAKVSAISSSPVEFLKLNVKLKTDKICPPVTANFEKSYWYYYAGAGAIIGTVTTLLIINNVKK